MRRLVATNMHSMSWDAGSSQSSEWVIASFESPQSTNKFKHWLESKNVLSDTKVLVTDDSWSVINWTTWDRIKSNLQETFCGIPIKLYDGKLMWCLEYNSLEIARFGRFNHEKIV